LYSLIVDNLIKDYKTNKINSIKLNVYEAFDEKLIDEDTKETMLKALKK
jgi:hypothetical protein